MQLSPSQRAAGVIVGLAAGDKNGGPQRLALLLSYSVLTHKAFNIKHIWNSYTEWYKKGGFDTGSTFVAVYKRVKANPDLEPKQISKSFYDNAIKNKAKPSVGIGSSHRAAVLSTFPFFRTPFDVQLDPNQNDAIETDPDKEEKKEDRDSHKKQIMKLEDVAFEESCLTHYAPLSRSCSIAVNYLCRALINGHKWNESLQICHTNIQDEDIKTILQIFIQNKAEINRNNYKIKLEMGGYAPEVLKAALYFLNEYETFDASLNASIQFAGNANYCPVLVGSIGGARYGIDAVIDSMHFKHKMNSKLIAKDAVSVGVDLKEFTGKTVRDFEVTLATQIGELWNKKEKCTKRK
eukprot:332644_1